MNKRNAFCTVLANKVLVPFTDSFDSQSSRWTGAGFAVGSGVATITPTQGTGLNLDPTFDDAAQWTAGTGWAVGSGVGTKTAGTESFLTNKGTAPTVGGWYTTTFDLVRNNGNFATSFGGAIGIIRTTSATFIQTQRALSTGKGAIYSSNTAAGTVDNYSIKPLTLSTCIASVQSNRAAVTVSVKATRTAGTQIGLVLNLNSTASPTNFILVYLDGLGNVKTDECVNGTYANIAGASGAVTYGAGKILTATRSGNNITVTYDGNTVGAQSAVTANNNTRHGIFSTYASNSFDDFSLT